MKTTFGIGPPANRSKMKDIRRSGLIFFLFTPQPNMTTANEEALRRLADEILKVLPDRRSIDNDRAQREALEATIYLHWGTKIKKILKVITPVGARQMIPSQFIGDVLKMWKTKIINQDLLPEDLQVFENQQISADQLTPGNKEFYKQLVANQEMSQQFVKWQLNISFK